MSSSPQGVEIETKTFLLTISTRDPVTHPCQLAIVDYVKANCDYGYVVTENGKSGKLHLHACLIFGRHRDKKKLQENITMRIVRTNGHPEAKNGLAVLVTVMYKHAWYDEYLKKEEESVVLYDNYDRDAVTDYFPAAGVQEYLSTKSKQRESGPVDKYMSEHLRRWTEFDPVDSSHYGAIRYFKTRMYVLEDMTIITDKRRLTQLAYALYEYRNKIVEPCMEEKRILNQNDGFNCDFAPPVAQHSAAKP